MKNKLVMAMITVVLASECFVGCSKKTIENSAASNTSVLEENEKEAGKDRPGSSCSIL